MTFNLYDNPVQQWENFKCFSLSHLDSKKVEYTFGKKNYTVYVTYSHHCFTKTEAGYNDVDCLEYNLHAFSRTNIRHFHFQRYDLSKKIPEIIQDLPNLYVFHAGHGGYASKKLNDKYGNTLNYKIVFNVFKSKKKIRLHVSSAHIENIRGKSQKVGFNKIIEAIHGGRKLPGLK